MRVLLVADQQNSFKTWKYARRLGRRLEKMGIKVAGYYQDFANAKDVFKQKKPDIIHLHYHPQSRKLRQVLGAAEEAGIPTVITYHKVARIPEGRREHIAKCLERTRSAFFLTAPDWQAACGINPRLRDAGEVIRMPSPHNLPETLPEEKAAVTLAFFAGKDPRASILYCEEIAPGHGVEQVLDMAASLPKGIRLTIAGTIPSGEGSYAKQLKARIAYEKLPIDWQVSKRPLGTKQLAKMAASSLFAYIPNGNPQSPEYDGASMHSMLIPFLNRTRTLVFSHRGGDTTADVEKAVHFLDSSAGLEEAVSAYHKSPDRFRQKIAEAESFSLAMDWPGLAKQMSQAYEALLSTPQKSVVLVKGKKAS